MAKVILICGKICSGKTAYAWKLMEHQRAILLSSDELISALFHPNESEFHDQVIGNAQRYLLRKSLDILTAGVDVILDWGFWSSKQRAEINQFYEENKIETEWHYLDIEDAELKKNIAKRNRDVLNNKTTDYYVDQGLLDKLKKQFETPRKEEIDVWLPV